MKKIVFLFFVASLAFSCQDEATRVALDEEVNQSVVGSWLYVEYGYSPGDKYHTVPVPADPPKTVTFESDFTMSSTNMELEKYKYYRLLEDTMVNRQVIAFFEQDPGNQALDLASLSPTYFTHWQGNYLNLNFRWCIEGCHMKFERISSVEMD